MSTFIAPIGTVTISEVPMDDRRYILWDPRDGEVRRDEDDEEKIISDGALGRIGLGNVYLTAYPTYRDAEDRRPRDLALGEHIHTVIYSLSGQTGTYDIYRVV